MKVLTLQNLCYQIVENTWILVGVTSVWNWSLKKTDGGNLAAADGRWLAPNAFHTITKQPSVYVKGTLITEQTDTYETILIHGTE